MATLRGKDSALTFPRQGGRYFAAPEDENVIQLVNGSEALRMWGATHKQLYRLVALGQLHAYGRPGRRHFYAAAELTALFGDPNGSGPRPAKLSTPDNGRNQQHFEFAIRPAA